MRFVNILKRKFTMRKMILAIGVACCASLMATHANAQFGVRGAFSSESNGGGWYTLHCDGGGLCGVLGATLPGGGVYFRASDGSEWALYSATVPNDDLPGIKEELEDGSMSATQLEKTEGE
ncbi:MAG: hypothetical protein QM642_00435 [Edaphocola sp.]